MAENTIGVITEETYNSLDPRIQKIWDNVPHEKQDIYNSVCDGMTFIALARKYNISAMRIRDIFNHTLSKLLNGINEINNGHEPWECYFDYHIYNVFSHAGIYTFDDLYNRYSEGILKSTTRGLGKVSIACIEKVLTEHGYNINDTETKRITITNLHLHTDTYYANVYNKNIGYMMVSFNVIGTKILNLRIYTESNKNLSDDLRCKICNSVEWHFYWYTGIEAKCE
jgi:ribosome-binding factor A